jgi:hypothetical protein
MPWPGPQQPTIEIRMPVAGDHPARQPAPLVYASRDVTDDRIRLIEAEVDRLTAIVEQLQQQQLEARRPRRHWYQRLTTVETWTDDRT